MVLRGTATDSEEQTMADRLPGEHETGYRGSREAELGFPGGETALLVIDPVNDFLSEGGAAWDLTKSTVAKNDVVQSLRRVIEATRAHGVPVIYAPMAYTAEDYEEHQLHRRSGIHRIMFERKMFLAGSWGAEVHAELTPQAGDTILEPHKGTDVFETDLPGHLDRFGTTHLVICGMTANLCCESTGRTAVERGYDVTYLSDAIGAESLPAYEASIHINYPLLGNAVMEVGEFLAALERAVGPNIPEKGDSVIGSDRGSLGSIEEVVLAGEISYMKVTRGVIFDKETYIPLDAVVRRVGTEVFVNMPRLVVGKMPWDAKPTSARRHDQVGPAAHTVDKLYRSVAPTGTK